MEYYRKKKKTKNILLKKLSVGLFFGLFCCGKEAAVAAGAGAARAGWVRTLLAG